MFKKVTYILVFTVVFTLQIFCSWVDVDKSGQDDRNVSNNPGRSFVPDIEFDSNGYPHVVWFDTTEGNYEVFYLKWNGNTWVDVDGSGVESANISKTSSESKYPKIELDSSDTPYIVWEEVHTPALGIADIYAVKWNGSTWVDMDGTGTGQINISNTSYISGHPDAVISDDDVLHVAWHDGQEGQNDPHPAEIMYLKWNGVNWVDAANDPGQSGKVVYSGTRPSLWVTIDYDSSNNAHIAWSDGDEINREIYYLYWNGSAWVDADGTGQGDINVSFSTGYSSWPNIDVDSSDRVHLVWEDFTPGILNTYYLVYDGGWTDVDGTGIGDINIAPFQVNNNVPRIRVDNAGVPHVIYGIGNAETNEIYCVKWNGSSWTDETGIGTSFINVSNDSINSSWAMIELDQDGYPNIAFAAGDIIDFGEIHYLRWAPEGTPTATQTITMTNTYDPLASPTSTYTISPTLTHTTTPSITPSATRTITPPSAATATPDVCWADADGAGREIMKIKIGKDPVVRLDSNYYPHITWEEAGAIYYIRWNGTSWVDADGTGTESIRISGAGYNYTHPDMEINSSDNPVISWTGGAYTGWQHVYLVQWNGSEWVDVDGIGLEAMTIMAAAGGYPENVSLELNSIDAPRIAWSDYYMGETWTVKSIHYMEWNSGLWTDADGTGLGDVVVSSDYYNAIQPDLALNSSGRPSLVWSEEQPGNSALIYREYNGSTWQNADGSTAAYNDIITFGSTNAGRNPSLKLDSSGNPHVVWDTYFLSGVKQIAYLKWTGVDWTDADGAGQESAVISDNTHTATYPSIDIGASGNAQIAYHSTDGVHFVKWNQIEWVDADGIGTESEIIASVASSPHKVSMEIGDLNRPHVVWSDTMAGGRDVYHLQYICDATDKTPTFTQTMTMTPTITGTFYGTITPTCTVTSTITPAAVELDIRKKASGSDPAVGSEILYEIFVENEDINPAENISVWDTLPAEVSYLRMESGPDPVISGNLLTWDMPGSIINPGMTMTIRFRVRINTISEQSLIINKAASDYNDPAHIIDRHEPVNSEDTYFPEGRVVVYPNPFNPGKAIYGYLKFLNTVPGSVIHIYTLSGEFVVMLEANSYITLWDGNNRYGSMVSPGIYYYVINNSGEITTGKLFIVGN